MNPAAVELQPQGVAETFEGELAGVVGTAIGQGDKAQYRTVLDDPAGPLFAGFLDRFNNEWGRRRRC